jgi:hypothetical protein
MSLEKHRDYAAMEPIGMISRLSNLCVWISTSAAAFVAVVFAMMLSIRALGDIAAVFPLHAGGFPPIDMQMFLGAIDIAAQLPAYTDPAKTLYFGFAAIDFIFPLAAGLVAASLTAFVLRRSRPALYATACDRHLFAWLLVPAALDYLENIFMVGIVAGYPDHWRLAEHFVAVAHNIKIVMATALMILTMVMAIAAIVFGGLSKRRSSR